MTFHSKLRGLDLHAPTNEQVENKNAYTIQKLQVVALDRMGTIFPKVQLANPQLFPTFGIAAQEILSNKSGFVTCLGFLFGVDTSAWIPGIFLYSDISGNLSLTPLASPIAQVIKQDTDCGVLYVFCLANMADSQPVGDDWHTFGNTGLDSDNNFVGNIDNVDFNIRTANLQRAKINVQGQLAIGAHLPESFVHIKAHSGYDHSGHLIDTFAVTTSDTNLNNAYFYTVPNNSVVTVRLTIQGRDGNADRASFVRTGCFFRNGSLAQQQGGVQSDFTQKSAGFQVKMVSSLSGVKIQVQAPTSNITSWVGTVEIDVGT